MLEKILSYPIDSPVKTIVLVLVFMIACASGLPRIIVEGNLEAMLDKQDPLLVQLHEVEAEFTQSHVVLIGVVSPTSIFTPEIIETVQSLTEQAWQTPYLYRVDSLTNFQYTQVENDDLLVGDLFPTDVPFDKQQFEKAKNAALTLPETLNQLVSTDEKMTAMHLSFNLYGESDYDSSVDEIISYIDQMLDKYRAEYPQLEFIVSGKLAIDRGIQINVAKDSVTLIPLMLIIMIIILFFLLRSVTATFGAILVVGFTGIAAMGVVGWLGGNSAMDLADFTGNLAGGENHCLARLCSCISSGPG